jgi:hypothetical protein
MAIGNYYPLSPSVVDEDLFLGTKSGGNNTVNYTAQTVSNYLNTNSKIAIGGQISFRFDIAPNIPKTISFSGGGGDGTLFSNITQLIVSRIDLSSTDITVFLNYLENSEILLSQQNQPNLFGHYKVTNYAQIGTSNFYTLDLDFIGGNGTITSNTFYNLNSFVLSSTIAVPNLNSVLTVGNTSLLDAKVGELYLYDVANADYGRITNEDSSFVAYEYTGQKTFSASSTDSQFIMVNANNKSATFNSLPLTATRIYDLPNASGTIALTSDIPSVTGYVPYTGATTDINIGTHKITADNGTTNSEMSPSLFAVENTAGTSYGLLEYNQLTMLNPAGSIGITASGITFSNASIQTTAFPPTGGTISQYIRGDGTLATFPTIPTVGTWGTLNYPTWVSGTPFVKMTATGTFALDTNTYLTSAVTSVTATSPITSSGGNTPIISTSMATNKLIGRSTAGVGVMEEITIGSGLSLSAGTLTASGTGTVTSVGLTMPSAFSVANSPVTGAGTLAVTGAGVASQYVRGDGTLANFPTSTGGGASVSYYLNGSISQGTIGGVAYKEMNSVPVIGAGTDFTINADGYIAQFITDVGNPNKLLIPAGNWNFETYFSASSGGGSPRFYIELYKYDGATFTLIATNSATPEYITGGTSIDLYFTALAVPATALLVTDRLAVRFYVIHSGRTITMHTEDSHLSQIITTFSSGLTALNGLTSQVQYFAVGTSGSDFNISSVTDTHTFNLPTASASNRGALSSTDYSFFFNKQPTLVNGTNIRGINGYSLLGSGGLTILGIHALIKPYSGLTYSASINQSAIGSASAQTANRLIVYPFIPANTFTCSSMYINVATLSIGALCQIVIYSDLNGFPDQKLYNSTDLDCSTTGKKTATTTQTFNAGTTYWIGTHSSSIASLTVISGAGLISPYIQNVSAGTAYIGTATYGSPPNPFGTTANTTGVVPFVGITI